jgi:hypothetical protein
MADGELRRARAAAASVFFVHGLIIAAWASRIPQIKAATGLDTGLFGLALLGAPVASLAMMRPASKFLTAFGSKSLIRVSAVPFGASAVLVAAASSGAWLALAMALEGAAGGALGVAMNAQGVEVERGYRRPLMNGFHAAYSLGGLAGAVAGSLAAHAGFSPLRQVAVVAAAGAAGCLAATSGLIPGAAPAAVQPAADQPAVDQSTVGQPVAGQPAGGQSAIGEPVTGQSAVGQAEARPPAAGQPSGWRPAAGGGRVLWALAVIVFCVLLSEGAMADWSALFLRDARDTAVATAALGYAAFSLAMTGGRLVGNRIVGALGPVTAVRAGAGLASVSLAAGLAAPSPAVAIAGFGLFGLGMCVVAPTAFSAAGNAPGVPAASALALVSGAGYAGLTIGPGAIGAVAQVGGLAVALAIPAALVASIVFLAPAVSCARGRQGPPADARPAVGPSPADSQALPIDLAPDAAPHPNARPAR